MFSYSPGVSPAAVRLILESGTGYQANGLVSISGSMDYVLPLSIVNFSFFRGFFDLFPFIFNSLLLPFARYLHFMPEE